MRKEMCVCVWGGGGGGGVGFWIKTTDWGMSDYIKCFSVTKKNSVEHAQASMVRPGLTVVCVVVYTDY